MTHTEDLVETRDVADFFVDNLLFVLVKNPEILLIHFDTADVSVRSDKNMLKLCLLLINLFYASLSFIIALGTKRLLLLLFRC